MPFGDWQFWLVTVIAAMAAWWVLRPLLPKRRSQSGKQTKVKLTIDGERRS